MNEISVKEIVCGLGGLNHSKAISEYPKQDIRDAKGITVEDDTWQKEGGATKINSTAITGSPTVMGLHDFWVSSSSQKKIAATSDGKIVEVDSGGIAATLKTGLGSNKQTVFVEGYGESETRKLFSFNGYDVPQVTSDGASTSDLSNPPADWSGTNQPTTASRHNNRVWAIGNANDQHRAYYSRTDDNEDFTGQRTTTLTDVKGSENDDSENVDSSTEPTNASYVSAYAAVAASAWTRGALTNPDNERNVCIVVKNDSGGALNLYEGTMTFTITGTHDGGAREEEITIESSAANKEVADGTYRYKYGTKPFDTVTNITLDNVPDDGLKIGAGLGSKFWLDYELANSQASDIVTATVNGTAIDPTSRVDGNYHTLNFGDLSDDDDLVATYTAYTGAGSINIFPGEGEKLVCVFSFAGRVFFWKYPFGIYWIDDSSSDTSEWTCQRMTKAVGMAGPLGLAQTDSDVIFISSGGVPHSLSAVEEFGDVESSAIFSEKIGGYIRDNLDISSLADAVAIYYPTKRQWQLAFQGEGYAYNNTRLTLDLHDEKNPRYTYSVRDECTAMALMRDDDGIERPVVGDRSGFIRFLDQSNRNKDSSSYTARFETSDIDLVERGVRRANVQYIEVIFRPEGNHDLSVEIYLDGEYKQTVLVNMGSGAGGSLGTFVLGTDTLGGGNVKNTRRRITGDCRRIKLVGYNSGLNENFSVSSILVGYTIGNER